MERWHKRVAVVTGASAGIGAAIVGDLLRAGMIVVGMARRKEMVEQLRSTLPVSLQKCLYAVHCDVADARSVDVAFDWVVATLGGCDVVVCNAGLYRVGQILSQDIGELQEIVQTNIMGVVHCLRCGYKSMAARNFDGHLVIINSVLGHSVFPTLAGTTPQLGIYPPTKHALTAMTEVLRQELRSLNTNIKITSISPGMVDTELVKGVNRSATPMLTAADVSQAVLYVIATGPNVQVQDVILKPVRDVY